MYNINKKYHGLIKGYDFANNSSAYPKAQLKHLIKCHDTTPGSGADYSEAIEVLEYIMAEYHASKKPNKIVPNTKALQTELFRKAKHKAELQAILDEEELAQAKHEATLKRIKRQKEQKELEQQELEHELEVTKANYETKAKIVELNHKIEAITEEYNSIKAKIRNSLNIDRTFTPQQRSTLYLNAGGKCQQCGDSVTINNFEADHIIAYSNGGQTTLDNGQCLCGHCNRVKGNK